LERGSAMTRAKFDIFLPKLLNDAVIIPRWAIQLLGASSWWRKMECPEEITDLSQVTEVTISVVIDPECIDCIDSCRSNYDTITTTKVPISKRVTFVFFVSPLITHNFGVRTKTGWLKIRIMCPSGTTYLPSDMLLQCNGAIKV
jgi:hypothetical protein